MVLRLIYDKDMILAALMLVAGIMIADTARAATIVVDPRNVRLVEAISRAAPGDVLRLLAGIHEGPVTISKQLTLAGEPGAIIRGSGTGNVITVKSPGVVIEGFKIGRASCRERV